MAKRVHIFGNHPIRPCLVKQFERVVCSVTVTDFFLMDSPDHGVPEELCILTSSEHNDTEALSFLQELAERHERSMAIRPLVHLFLQSPNTLRALLVSDFSKTVHACPLKVVGYYYKFNN